MLWYCTVCTQVGGLPWALEASWTETKNGRQRWTAPPLNARAVAYLRKDVLLSGRCASPSLRLRHSGKSHAGRCAVFSRSDLAHAV